MKYILFVCTENSARSQIAEAFFNFYNKNPQYLGISAGIQPASSVKPDALIVMQEKGIDLSKAQPKLLTSEMTNKAEKIFTMGCIKTCPITPPEKTEDWNLDDPAGKPIDKLREVRDEIETRVKKLILTIVYSKPD
ncbi:arsenate reductase ArsC [Candidatus Micrarchaeota archaeon]|nr:arsenate reductase ArsC [Candidatus Micrarchaeota archaeon]